VIFFLINLCHQLTQKENKQSNHHLHIQYKHLNKQSTSRYPSYGMERHPHRAYATTLGADIGCEIKSDRLIGGNQMENNLQATLSIDTKNIKKEFNDLEKQADRILEKMAAIKRKQAGGN